MAGGMGAPLTRDSRGIGRGGQSPQALTLQSKAGIGGTSPYAEYATCQAAIWGRSTERDTCLPRHGGSLLRPYPTSTPYSLPSSVNTVRMRVEDRLLIHKLNDPSCHVLTSTVSTPSRPAVEPFSRSELVLSWPDFTL